MNKKNLIISYWSSHDDVQRHELWRPNTKENRT